MRQHATRSQRGFSLTELIMVIVILGVLGVGITSFITRSVGGYIDTGERQRMATAGLVAAEKLTRDLRGALPNSVRTNSSNSCVEFIPIYTASTYIDIPVDLPGTTIRAVSDQRGAAVSGRMAVYPINTAQLYTPSATGALTQATATLPPGNGAIDVTLSAAHRFPLQSPTRRFYIVGTPEAYCQTGTSIHRYSNYDFNPGTGSLPPSGADVALLINQVQANSARFDYSPASLVRNAVVNFRFRLFEGNEQLVVEQEAAIRNLP
ncbi:type II secretion system protein [Allohahella marinimesophila]|uniref:Type II secretion system protein n=1 Tax=Allohahella marinimesophila TaxID=1054972 RepID=A0ABP7NWU3_9GAMM